MGKKKSGKRKQPKKKQWAQSSGNTASQQMKNPFTDLLGEIVKTGITSKPSPVQKMTAPPETLIEHLIRIGAQFWVAEAGVTEGGNVLAEPCLTIPWAGLIYAEAEHTEPGSGDKKVHEANQIMISESAKRAVEEVQSFESPYFRIDGRKISSSGGEVVYQELRSSEELAVLGIEPGTVHQYDITTTDGTGRQSEGNQSD